MADIQFDNVDSSLSCLEDLKDPRSYINRLHIFGDLIVICIMAVIAGADGPEVIGTWADSIYLVKEAPPVAQSHPIS